MGYFSREMKEGDSDSPIFQPQKIVVVVEVHPTPHECRCLKNILCFH